MPSEFDDIRGRFEFECEDKDEDEANLSDGEEERPCWVCVRIRLFLTGEEGEDERDEVLEEEEGKGKTGIFRSSNRDDGDDMDDIVDRRGRAEGERRVVEKGETDVRLAILKGEVCSTSFLVLAEAPDNDDVGVVEAGGGGRVLSGRGGGG